MYGYCREKLRVNHFREFKGRGWIVTAMAKCESLMSKIFTLYGVSIIDIIKRPTAKQVFNVKL